MCIRDRHTTSDWNANREEYKVSAFSPDMANLQYVNGHLLIPRPYGPRMLTADAIQIVRETLISVGPVSYTHLDVYKRQISDRSDQYSIFFR